MPTETPARRDLLRRGFQILCAASLLPFSLERANAAAACSDASSESLRASLHYRDAAANPKQSCGQCSFFTPPEGGQACGNCAIVNDMVNPKGHCDSWAAKT